MRRRALGAALLVTIVCLRPAQAAPAPANDPGPWLVFDIANSSYTTNQGGNFVVEVKCEEKREIVYRGVWGAEPGVWLPQAVNLAAHAGLSVKLRLQTIAAYYYSNACFLFWGRPRVVVGPLDGPAPPVLVADLTESFRLGKDCRRYVHDAERSGPLKTDQYDFTGGYYGYGQAGPWAEPALFGHPFCYGFQSWAGYEFDVTLPARPDSGAAGTAPAAAPPGVLGGGSDRPMPVLAWEQQVYRAAEGGFARFDPVTMRLEARMPHTEQGFGYAFAGFEARGSHALWLRLEFDRYEPWAGYGEMGNNRFVGVVLDYHTPGGYARRVWLHYPPIKPAHPEWRCERRAPTWHLDLLRPRRVLEVNWEQLHAELPRGTPQLALRNEGGSDASGVPPDQIVGLDLPGWAPPDWDGRFWFGIGLQDAGSDRRFAATVLDPTADR